MTYRQVQIFLYYLCNLIDRSFPTLGWRSTWLQDNDSKRFEQEAVVNCDGSVYKDRGALSCQERVGKGYGHV